MRNLFIFIFLFYFILGNSQGENNNWYFGQAATLNFAFNPPISVSPSNSSMNQYEGVASISDSNGNLLFYSDGITIWNRIGTEMPNGNGLTGDISSCQSVIIIPYPEQPKKYFIITNPRAGLSIFNYVSYSIIDMDLNNGFGDIPIGFKNIALKDENGLSISLNSEGLTSVINDKGNGYWVLIKRDKLYSFPITKNGFSNIPIISLIPNNIMNDNGVEHIKISPDNTKISITKSNSPSSVKIYNFNNFNGQIDNSYSLEVIGNALYTSEFSPDNKILYITSGLPGEGLKIVNLETFQYRSILNSTPYYGTIQRTKHNDIYITKFENYLDKINNPNDYFNSNILLNNIFLNNYSSLGLPQLIQPLWCQDNLNLNYTEFNNNFNYQVSNSIITNGNYKIDIGKNINLYAGNSINLSPNTYLTSGSNVLAKIQNCPISSNFNKNSKSNNPKSIKHIINFDENLKLIIFPNPSKDYIEISLKKEKIKIIKITSIIDSALIFEIHIEPNSSYQYDISQLKTGIYIVNVITDDGKSFSEKLIKN